jgi:DNA-binding HxlR family transcriptional regulator
MSDDWRETWDALGDLLAGKWTFHVLRLLAEDEYGFNEMSRALGVTPKVLTTRLRELVCRGFVAREVHPTSPPTTTYRLTERGSEFVSHLRAMEGLVEVVDCCEPTAFVDEPGCVPGFCCVEG